MDFETILLEWAFLHGNCAVNGIPEDIYKSFRNYSLRSSNIRFKKGVFASRKTTQYRWDDVVGSWDLKVIMSYDEIIAEMLPGDVSASSALHLEDIL